VSSIVNKYTDETQLLFKKLIIKHFNITVIWLDKSDLNFAAERHYVKPSQCVQVSSIKILTLYSTLLYLLSYFLISGISNQTWKLYLDPFCIS
jgi:hypothetical protein